MRSIDSNFISIGTTDALLVFDGTNIYSLVPLPEHKRVTVNVGKKTMDLVTVKSVRLGTEQGDSDMLMNIIFRKVLEISGYKRIFDDFYDMTSPLRIEDDRVANSIDIFPGIISEISQRMVNGRPQYCLSLDPTHKVVSKDSILALLRSSNDPNKTRRMLKGKRVTTWYNYKTYGVEDIDFNKNPGSTFIRTNRKTGEEETISFADYMAEMNLKVSDMRQPLLVSTGRQRERIYLLPEFCVPAVVPASAKAKLPQITSIKPAARVERINSLLKLVTEAGQRKAAAALAQYGMQVDTRLLAVQRTVLPSPPLIFAPKTEVKPGSEWRREAANVKFSNITQRRRVQTLIVYDSYAVGRFAMDYWTMIKKQLQTSQAPLEFATDTVFGFDARKYNGNFEATLADATKALPANHNPRDVLVIAFIATNKRTSTADYDAYRQFCLTRGYIGQGIDASDDAQRRKMDNRNCDSILGNLARQIVNKFGYQSWWINVPSVLPKQANKQFLFIGIDVFHAPPQLIEKDKGVFWQKRSIAGYTAKLVIGQSTLLYCATEVRDAGAEIAGQRTQDEHASSEVNEAGASVLREKAFEERPLANFVQSALTHWAQYVKPTALVVIVYRDGVADSQMDLVDQNEVAQLKTVVPPESHLIYSIVQKRVHNRFVMADQGRYGNCSAGTVVEELARVGDRYNFFMVPCATNLSTNKPVNYTITHNSHPQAMTHQEFHSITFASHHTYQNWAGTVKVPDVCQYAHKLAYTLGESRVVDPHVHRDLKPTMFYL